MGGGIASRHAVAVAQHRYHFWQIRHYSDRRGAASGRCAKFASRRLDPHLVLASGTVLSTASLLDSVPHLASDAPLRGIILLQSGPLGWAWRRTTRFRAASCVRPLPDRLAEVVEGCAAAFSCSGVPILCSAETAVPVT